MSSYRRGPNVSQYIANLNNPNMDTSPTSKFVQDDLGQFDFSTEFFDFDMGQTIPSLPENDVSPPQPESNPSPTSLQNDVLLNTDFDFNDFSFPADLSSAPNSALSSVPASTLFPNPLTTRTKSRPNPTSTTSAAPKPGDKRKLDALSSSDAAAEAARFAAEEDKRRRNTAASARFRIKKKQREQALEKTAKEMTEKAAMLETKVQQLEMENKWLKGLITEKTLAEEDEGGDEGSVGMRTSKRELEEMWRSFRDGQSGEGGKKRGKGERA